MKFIKNVIIWLVVFYCCGGVACAGNLDIKWLAPYLMPPGHANTNKAEWTASQGEIFAFSDVVVVRLRFDQESVDVFNYLPGFGLDVDVVECTNDNPINVSGIQHTFPTNAHTVRDTSLDDNVTNSSPCKNDNGYPHVIGSILLRDPEHIVVGQDYYVYYHLQNPLPCQGTRLHLTLQLSFDVQLISPPVNELISRGAYDLLDYFVLESDSFASFTALPNQDHGTCWKTKTKSYNCVSSNSQCVASNERRFNLLDFFVSTAYAARCVGGVYAPSMNVRIGVPMPSTSGSGYTDDSGTSNPWAGYNKDVGLKYMKIGKKSSGHWSGSKTWTVGEIPDKRDFRIKLKQKGGVWPDEACAEVWFSGNEHFTGEDLFLKRKCKDLSNETEDERSIYVKDVHLPTMEAGEDYYFFTVVTYPGGANPSSEGDNDEQVKVNIVENPDNQYNQTPTQSTLSPAQIMFILNQKWVD